MMNDYKIKEYFDDTEDLSEEPIGKRAYLKIGEHRGFFWVLLLVTVGLAVFAICNGSGWSGAGVLWFYIFPIIFCLGVTLFYGITLLMMKKNNRLKDPVITFREDKVFVIRNNAKDPVIISVEDLLSVKSGAKYFAKQDIVDNDNNVSFSVPVTAEFGKIRFQVRAHNGATKNYNALFVRSPDSVIMNIHNLLIALKEGKKAVYDDNDDDDDDDFE